MAPSGWVKRAGDCTSRSSCALGLIAGRGVPGVSGPAVHVLDRFHIMVHLNKAIDEVRAREHILDS